MYDNFNVTSGLAFQSTTSDLPCYDEDVHYPSYFRYITSRFICRKAIKCDLNLRPCEAEHSEMRRMAAGYEADDGRYFYSGSKGPTCSVDGWYDKVQQSRENATQLYWDG